jgi:outer membrane protein TolC
MAQYVEQQVVLPSDQLAVQAGQARQEHQGLVLRQSITTYREQLNALLARDLDEPFTVVAPDIALAASIDVAAAEAQALAARPEVRIARLQTSQAEFDWRATRAAALPEISLAFSYLGFYNFEVLPKNVASVGILGSWEPWDWGRKKREVESKRVTADQTSLATEEAERRVRLDVRATARAVAAARGLLRVADLARAPLRDRVRVALDRFKLDAALQRDVLQAQTALADAEQQYQQALAGFWTARAEFERAIAED